MITARFPSRCFSCGELLAVGDEIDYFRDVDRTTYWGHPGCVAIHSPQTRRGTA
jgi:hypothetical protein